MAQPGDPFASIPARPGKMTFADYGKVTMEVSPKAARPGETVTVKVTVAPSSFAWTYPNKPSDPAQAGKNNIQPPPPGDLIFVGGVTDPPGAKTKPRDDKPDAKDEYYPSPATCVMRAVVSPRATPGAKTVKLTGTGIQICTENSCLYSTPNELPTGEITVLDGPAVSVDPKYAGDVEQALNPKPTRGSAAPTAAAATAAPAETGNGRKAAKSLSEYQDGLELVRGRLLATEGTGDVATISKETGLGSFLATAALWGLISLVTPCVFPMIPITVSIFLKQAHGSLRERLKLAGVYCVTIITVLGFSAFALLKFMAWLSAHPVTNLLLGGLFLVLALSLFGMY